ncbi:MAG: S41 family peptidase [Bacteroidales bacterium]|nr:S41 family peptidase [Bacteroidales bacterium]
MKGKDTSASLVALLGVILGIVLTMTITSIVKQNMKTRVDPYSWQKLNVILQEVQKRYVDTVDVKGMTDAAVVSALAKLDPHSVYLPPQDLEESETELAGNFDGIGIQFNVPNDTAIVLEVIAGGPSEKVGLQPGDRLLKVDDKVIAGVNFPQDSMVRRMKGPSGSKVTVTVLRGKEEIPFEITRGKIPVHCVDASFMIDDNTGYIRLTKFSRTTYKEVSDAAVALLKEGMKRLIFDIRDNTGGYLDQALLLSNMFLSRGDEIVFLKGRNYEREDHKADGRGILQDIDLSVLINESSASSSEIFAGAIQDNDRGVIVGRRSFGKGLVQEPVFFTDGSGVRITIARFYTPSGRCIQKPYGDDDYGYDIYRRYEGGEMFAQDSIKVDSAEVYKTVGGRTVYGGGGIIPDVFVPMDTTKATSFFVACNRKTTQMRFASDMFDRYRDRLLAIDNYPDLEKFLSGIDIKGQFLEFARKKDSIVPKPGEWEATESYLMPQLRALVGRYSKLGDNAFYKLYLPVDETVAKALAAPSKVSLP